MTVSRLRGLPPSAWCLGLAAWFLLPAAFQTGLTFLSEVRGVWEGLYLLLSLWLVWRTRALWQTGPWRAVPALCAARRPQPRIPCRSCSGGWTNMR